MSVTRADAVVIGAGPNGLAAGCLLAQAGWDTVVVEAETVPGGAVRSAELTAPGFTNDVFSAFYPLAAASPVFAGLHLEEEGLRWLRAPLALASPTPDGRCAAIGPDPDATAPSLEEYAAGDGDGWRRLTAQWERHGDAILDALFSPFPPVRAGLKLAGAARIRGALDLARLAVTTARRLGEEHFAGEGGRLLLAGNALHSDLTPESAGSGLYGWILCCLAQYVGFPVPEGGAGSLTRALVRRLERSGGRLRLGERVEEVLVSAGRAGGVRTAGGERIMARRAVLADVAAPHLYRRLLDWESLPSRLRDGLERFEWDPATVKVDWALSSPIPWSAPAARRAGTVHVAAGVDELTWWSAAMATRRVPAAPFLLVGQQSMTDPSRQPPGAETAWAYTHVPRDPVGDEGGAVTGRWDGADAEAMAERIEGRIEALAPGFKKLVVARHVMLPPGLEARDANLDTGAINGGSAQLHQQLVFRPTPGLGRPETVIEGLYLASSSAHPGGGVHGACGANAARAALAGAAGRRIALAATRAAAGGDR